MKKAFLICTLSFLVLAKPAVAEPLAAGDNEVAYSTLIDILFDQETDSIIERSGVSRDRYGNPFYPCQLTVSRITKNKSIVIELSIPSYQSVSFYSDLTSRSFSNTLRIADDFRRGDQRITKIKQVFNDSQRNTWISEDIVTLTLGNFDIYGLNNLSSISVDNRYRTKGDSSITCDF